MEPVYVTKPFLPPLEEFTEYLKQIWDSGILTHNGPFLNQFERELQKYLQLDNVICVSNGTIAIQMAIKALRLQGEIITTPFTFIATADAILWEKCSPIFVDIDPETLTISIEEIEKNINEKTVAIVGVHVFGNPCDVESIDAIGKKHNLKVIYDGAHAFGIRKNNKSILSYGDISTVSFHATKLLQTFEGGAVITLDNDLAQELRRLRFFGYEGRDIQGEGFNGKMTEVSAAMGIVNLNYIDGVIARRKTLYEKYTLLLSGNKNISLQKINPDCFNYSYFPVIFRSQEELLRVEGKLKEMKIYPRRYFYPLLHTLEFFESKKCLPVAEDTANSILCLPLYDSLEVNIVEMISEVIKEAI